jgi:hypothetical protein
MLRSLKSFFTVARLRAPVIAVVMLVFAGCDNSEPLSPSTAAVPEVEPAAFAGGIPFGNFIQPISAYGSLFNGAHANIAANLMVQTLTQIRSRGGRVVLTFTGNLRHYVDGSGHFNLSKWKARVDRFKGINLGPFINDGTIIGHYMIDEPNDPANWNGKPVPPSMLEEMARYSKQIWPNLATIVRVDPKYLGTNHRYLDAAWAQFLWRRGDPNQYIKTMVSEAQHKGLQLVVGLNVIQGGNPQGTLMTAKQVETFGSALLSSNYPCAFISWHYKSSYVGNGSIRDAMNGLRRKAQSRPSKTCRS